MMKVINLFAGPGAGKSTTAAGLFYLMKNAGMNVELVTEYAKDLTWEKRFDMLTDQLYVLAKQNRRLQRLEDQVDFVVTDSPILLSYHYVTPDYLPLHFRNLVIELWDQYDNYNIVIERVKPYLKKGRSQDEDEAKKIDIKINKMLSDLKIETVGFEGDGYCPQSIFDSYVFKKMIEQSK